MTVLTLAEAKAHLNIPADDTTDDLEVAAMIDAAEAAISRECGPLEPTPVTERVRGARCALDLSTTPIISVTSVTPIGGSAILAADLDVDLEAGVVYLDSGGRFGARRYEAVYTAGRVSLPSDLVQAVKELVRHMWATQRGGMDGLGGALPVDEGEAMAGTEGQAAYTFPRRVEQLMQPHIQAAI